VRIRRLLVLVLAGLIVVAGGYAGYSAVRSQKPVSLAPGGPFAVGRTVQEWLDLSRASRPLSVWVWYPVRSGTPGQATAPYAPGAWENLHQFGIGQTAFSRIRTGTLLEAPIADGTFPIVVLMPGMGFSAPQYATIAASLAARGYVVAGVTPTYSANVTVLDNHLVKATTDGDPSDLTTAEADRLVAVWAADAQFTARRIVAAYQDHVDARHVLYVGHSFGGAASLEACRQDASCAGAADLDGTPYGPVVGTGLTKPLLLLSSGSDGAATDTSTRLLFHASSGAAHAYTIPDARHFDFTDYAAYYLAAPLRLLLPLGRIDGRRALTITSGYLGAFADSAARGSPWTAPTYPEIHPAEMLG
jgi:predicted dienelactone hydrolase